MPLYRPSFRARNPYLRADHFRGGGSIQRKNTNGYRAMWSAKGEAAVRTVVATARMTSGAGTFSTVLDTVGA